jgi:drug/metabolite transporter (DMT)-like permease
MKTEQKNILPSACLALGSALLFGASTPIAKLLLVQVQPELFAGLLYFGSGLGLLSIMASGHFSGVKTTGKLNRIDFLWLAAAIICGGIAATLLLMLGLKAVSGGEASLLLNLEAVFTAIIAWSIYEHEFESASGEEHSHWHRHDLTHTHSHFPDLHHRHKH